MWASLSAFYCDRALFSRYRLINSYTQEEAEPKMDTEADVEKVAGKSEEGKKDETTPEDAKKAEEGKESIKKK